VPNLILKINNYRNITNQITLELKEGISFILGVNNIGKSNILKFLYECKPIFRNLSQHVINGNDGNFAIEMSIPFDQIANRKKINNPVSFEFSHANERILVEVTPTGETTHTKTVLVKFEMRLTGGYLRFLQEQLLNLSKSQYIGAFRNAIEQSSASYYDITIGEQFIQTWSSWATGKNIAQREKINTLIHELQELFDFQKFEIKISDDKKTLLITTDDGTFELNELGGGIAHVIIVLGNITIKNPPYILIDEPELSLHPRMQEIFTRTLASKAQCGVIASSHSVGLARSCADQILSLTCDQQGRRKLVPFGQHFNTTISQMINEMGYSQFAETGGNNILLVEGRTDIKVYREILRLFGIENKFIIMSLGGRQFFTTDKTKIIEELTEIKRLNPKSIAVIIDSEKRDVSAPVENERLEFKTCCENLGFKTFITDHRSTENYISAEALNKVLNNQYTPLTPFEDFNTKNPKWAKEKNWLLFREMRKEDFDHTELGKFINENLIPLAKE
jgi:predicted ATPase